MKELLSLSRRMKELWAFGPLGREDPDQRAKDEKLNSDVRRAYELLCKVEQSNLEDLAAKYGGTWEAGNGEDATAAVTIAPGEQGVNGTANGNSA